jgi:ABC-2 type transport system permease protein
VSAAVASPGTATRPAPIKHGYRFELVKLVSQWRIRLALLGCWIGPALFVAAVSRQTSLPADTVFGRWMGQSGWAGPLVILSFCCSWLLPLVTALVAGDVFAAEDRFGTWRHLLVAVRSPRRIFAAKTLAALTVLLVLVAGLAASGVFGGLAGVGDQTLVGLSGQPLASGHAATAVLLAWACSVAPTLAFAAVGLLGSVALGRSPMGLFVPALLALVLQLAQLLPLPVAVRVALPSYPFLAWRGLFTEPTQLGPIVLGTLVSLGWAVAATALAYRLFMRRDFTDLAYDGAGKRIARDAVLPLAAVLALCVAACAVAVPGSGSGIDRTKLQASLATAFAHLYRLQTRELHRAAVTEQQLHSRASCDKGGPLVDDLGPGNDWRCVVSWRLPGSTATGSAVYQLDVTSDGRYVADGDGPQAVNGFFQVRTTSGDAPNPLWQFDGSVDLLTSTAKG